MPARKKSHVEIDSIVDVFLPQTYKKATDPSISTWVKSEALISPEFDVLR